MIQRGAAEYGAINQGTTTTTTTTSSSATASTTACTTARSRSNDPRIVRVSRAYGGKDRHSKVSTVRGLRDRRVRLSVPTAIQLYDLQDRLGLSQPSKVVDWLLNAAKNEIDELPPLQIPEGGFLINPNLDHHHHHHHHHEFVASHEPEGQGPEIKSEEGCSNQFNLENNLRISSNYPIYNSFVRLDPSSSNLTLSHNPPRTLIGSTANQDLRNLSLVNPSLSESPPPHHHHRQVLVYQHGLINTQHFNYPSSNSSSLSSPLLLHHHSTNTHLPVIRPFHFSMSDANLNLPLQDNAENDQQQ